MPGDMKSKVSSEVKNHVHSTSYVFKNVISCDLSKVGHFCFFVLFGLVLSILLNREPAILIMTNILLLAGGTEIVQFYAEGQ